MRLSRGQSRGFKPSLHKIYTTMLSTLHAFVIQCPCKKRGGTPVYQVEGYWKVQLVCLVILAVLIAAMYFGDMRGGIGQEAIEISECRDLYAF